MNSKARIAVLTVLNLALLAVLGMTWFLMAKAERETQENISEAGSLSGNDSWTRSIRSIESGSETDLASVSEAAITRDELIPLLESLESAGRSMALEVLISSITAEGEVSSSTPQTMMMTIDTEGPWRGSLAFVRLLENLPAKSSVESTTMNLSGDAWRSSTTLKVTVFP